MAADDGDNRPVNEARCNERPATELNVSHLTSQVCCIGARNMDLWLRRMVRSMPANIPLQHKMRIIRANNDHCVRLHGT